MPRASNVDLRISFSKLGAQKFITVRIFTFSFIEQIDKFPIRWFSGSYNNATQHQLHIRVIPSHFNNFFHITISELDETWYTSSAIGFVMTPKLSLSFSVWLPG